MYTQDYIYVDMYIYTYKNIYLAKNTLPSEPIPKHLPISNLFILISSLILGCGV